MEDGQFLLENALTLLQISLAGHFVFLLLLQQGNQARFDFDGNLVSKIDNIPEYLGLHHHGDDPNSAGYTLEELFVLARSSFLQQRVFALQVLARIIRQVRILVILIF